MGRVIGILVTVALAAGVFWYRSGQSEKLDAKIEATQAKVLDVIARAKDSGKFSAYVDQHAASANTYAMSIAYTPKARRQSPKFDAQKYASAFCESLLQKQKFAKADDQSLSLYLRQLEIDMETAVKNGEFE